jgi:chromosome segregation ATPase
MSLGNGNAKASNKGSNFSHELKTLKVLNAINASTGAGATEATLLALLAAVEATRDYEVRIVNDSNPGGEVTFLEVRYWDAQDGTLGSPVYFLPGDNTPYAVGDPGGPVAPLSYVPTSTLLSQILAELVGVNSELDAIKGDTANLDVALSTRATEATLDAFATANSNENAAISGELASLLLTLTTFASENGTDLDEVKAKLDEVSGDISDFDSNNSSNLDSIITLLTSTTATESTLQAVQALLGTIDADTSNLDVALSTRATEATLAAVNAKLNSLGQKTSADSVPVVLSSEQEAFINDLETLLTAIDDVLDNIKLDTAALVVDLAAIEVLITSTNSLLTTIDGVLDDIKAEVLEQGLSLDALVTDAAAIEQELLEQGLTLDSVKTELESVDDRLTAKTVTPNLVRATGAGTIAPAVYSFSIANVGAGNGDITIGANPPVAIKPTESLTFDAGSLNNQYAAGTIAYDGSGTELVIIFNS